MSLHPRADEAVRGYLDTIDAAAPGVVTELYVDGSATLGDFQPGTSDLNFVAVTASGIADASWSAVEEAHRLLLALDPGCPLDGIYLDNDELASTSAVTCGRSVRAGAYASLGPDGRNALRWHALAGSGEVVRGDSILPRVPAWLRAQHLDLAVLEAAESRSDRRDAWPISPSQAVASQVLDVARLHYTFATARFCSKAKAGLYGLVTFPTWGALIESALRVRRDPLAQVQSSRHEVADFMNAVLADLRDLASGG